MRPSGDVSRAYLRYSHVGLQFALTIGLFAAGGWWVDEKLGTSPLVLMIAFLVGPSAAFYSLYRAVYDGEERSESEPPGGEDDEDRSSTGDG